MDHSKEFLALVANAQADVKEIALSELIQLQEHVLIDVREDNEWQAGYLKNAIHLGRGIIERDIIGFYPNKATFLVLYCGGGYRSILAAKNLQLMGYCNVYSLIGGYKAGVEAGLLVSPT